MAAHYGLVRPLHVRFGCGRIMDDTPSSYDTLLRTACSNYSKYYILLVAAPWPRAPQRPRKGRRGLEELCERPTAHSDSSNFLVLLRLCLLVLACWGGVLLVGGARWSVSAVPVAVPPALALTTAFFFYVCCKLCVPPRGKQPHCSNFALDAILTDNIMASFCSSNTSGTVFLY